MSGTTHAKDAAHARETVSQPDSRRLHVQRRAHLARVRDPELSLLACTTADNSAMWMLDNMFDLPGTAEESSFFEDGCPTGLLTLRPHQHAIASLPSGARRTGLPSAEARRTSASVGNMVTVPEVLADLSGVIGQKVRRGVHYSDLVHRIWRSVRDLRDMH